MAAQHRKWSLAALLEPWCQMEAEADVEVLGMGLDSREIQPGWVFCAVQGEHSHGLRFLPQALERGAVAVLSDREPEYELPVPVVVMPDLKVLLGPIAARFHGDPSRQMTVIGVTGTDGKSSVAHYIAQALAVERANAAIVGTLGYGYPGELKRLRHTTPDALTVQAILAELRDQNARWVVMEASSHGLAQDRLNGVAFDQAVLTHLSRDHLDYHGTQEAYAAAKQKLFSWPGLDVAVINLDDAFGRKLLQQIRPAPRWIAYTLEDRKADDAEVVFGRDLVLTPHGISLHVVTPWGDARVESALYGRFNAANLLAALASLLGLGVHLADAAERLRQVSAVPGRMERFQVPGKPLAIVDYAHTPGALEAALGAIRAHGARRIICVFGAGGERDAGKRPLMSGVAERYADLVILTDDNPRGEAPGDIVADLLTGMRNPESVEIIHDRKQAILSALGKAEAEDVVLIAGKGHETEQITAEGAYPHSDRDFVAAWMSGEAI